MKKEEVVSAINEFLTFMTFEDADLPDTENDGVSTLKKWLKEASMWLELGDELSQETVNTIAQLDWKESDFKNLEEDQQVVSVFVKFGIPIPGTEVEEAVVVEEKPKPKKKVTQKKKEPEPELEQEEEDPPATEPEESPAERIENAQPVSTRRKPGPKKGATGPGAYGMAIEIMCTDPDMPLHDLYDAMEANGFTERNDLGSAKTARSVVLRVYNKLKENGYISNGK